MIVVSADPRVGDYVQNTDGSVGRVLAFGRDSVDGGELVKVGYRRRFDWERRWEVFTLSYALVAVYDPDVDVDIPLWEGPIERVRQGLVPGMYRRVVADDGDGTHSGTLTVGLFVGWRCDKDCAACAQKEG